MLTVEVAFKVITKGKQRRTEVNHLAVAYPVGKTSVVTKKETAFVVLQVNIKVTQIAQSRVDTFEACGEPTLRKI